jgi:hypothetical protein
LHWILPVFALVHRWLYLKVVVSAICFFQASTSALYKLMQLIQLFCRQIILWTLTVWSALNLAVLIRLFLNCFNVLLKLRTLFHLARKIDCILLQRCLSWIFNVFRVVSLKF